jgi:hypothetical protein
MNVALLVLRVIVGGLFVGHGCQKLLGWFGGHGPRGTASFFGGVGLAPALPLALLAGAAELVGGLLLGGGDHALLLTRRWTVRHAWLSLDPYGGADAQARSRLEVCQRSGGTATGCGRLRLCHHGSPADPKR